jgi:hypothetical protein
MMIWTTAAAISSGCVITAGAIACHSSGDRSPRVR